MNSNSSSRVYAFIDSQNLNLNVQKLGWKMDWHKFRRFLADTYGVSKAFMFIGYVPEFESLYEQLHETGYAVVLKPTFDMTRLRSENEDQRTKNQEETTGQTGENKEKPEEKKPVKGNIDADLVLWAMKELSNYDKAIIVSGDGDFYSLVEYLQEQGKLLKLLTPSRFYSGLFNRFDEYIVRLDQSRKQLAYHDHRRRKPTAPAS